MLYLKSVIVLATIACSFVAANIKEERKKKCTFKCSTLHEPLVGGCATIIGHDFQGLPNKWQIKHAYKTEGHKQLWNCLGTGMEISICCLSGKIVIPPKANPRVMTIEGFDPGYGNICGDSSPLDKNSPGVKDCI
ncbi:hypothetical protein MJO29_001373 [Puccinia striiformis f. sp. tritici]|nr:hypothetical protein MJO29_001373 [Puccinia striiformis f. sp. tritici]